MLSLLRLYSLILTKLLLVYSEYKEKLFSHFPCFVEQRVKRRLGDLEIILDGNSPEGIKVLDRQFYLKFFTCPDVSLGLGETFISGFWRPNNPQQFFHHLHGQLTKTDGQFCPWSSKLRRWLKNWLNRLIFDHIITCHLGFVDRNIRLYSADLGIQRAIFGSTLQPSCACWNNQENPGTSGTGNTRNSGPRTLSLDEAQWNKMHLYANKLKLKPGMTVLDIGCGCGTLAKFLCQNYGVSVIGVEISDVHVQCAREINVDVDGVTILLQNFLEMTAPADEQKFDRIIAVEVLAHMGRENFGAFFQKVKEFLKDDGLFLLHCIAATNRDVDEPSPWFYTKFIGTYEFPSALDIASTACNLFQIEDWQTIDYFPTLKAWLENTESKRTLLHQQLHQINSVDSDETRKDVQILRMFSFIWYLQTSACAYEKDVVWHILFSHQEYKMENTPSF